MSTNIKKHHHPNRPNAWLLFFSLLGFVLRLYNLDLQPLWGDEGWSFYFAGQSLGHLLALTAIDIHPPLYYILLKGWLAISGVEAETARFLSVIIGTLLIPLSFLLGYRLFEKRVGVMAAAVVSLMPLAIYYSQEVRMYGLVTLLGALSVYCFVRWQSHNLAQSGSVTRDVEEATALADRLRAGETWGRLQARSRAHKWLIAYVLAITAALYSHYYAVLILCFQLLYVLPKFFGGKPAPLAQRLTTIFSPFIAVGLLYLPWLLYVIPRLSSYVENKRHVEGYLPLGAVRFFGDHFVAFSLGHVPFELRPYVWAALPFILVASFGFIAALYFNQDRPYACLFFYLFTPLLMGYGINLIFPFNPPYFERTLLLAAPAYWLFIAAGIIWLWDRQYLLVGSAVLAMLMVSGVALAHFYSAPRYPHQDYRPLLQKIAAQATPQDTILASYQWQWGFYQAYLPPPRPRLFSVPGWGQGWAGQAGRPRLNRDVAAIFEASPRLWFPAYQASGHIWEDEAERVINDLGYPALLQWYGPQTKLILAGAPATSLLEGPAANFEGRIYLLDSKVGAEVYEAGRGIVPVELTWQKIKSLGSEHRLSLRLADAGGRTWASRDSHPQGGQAFFTDLAPGERLADRHGLLIPAGTPPGLYRLLLSIRRVSDERPLDVVDAAGQPLGAELLLAEVKVIDPTRPLGPAALPIQYTTQATFGGQVSLVGYSLGRSPFKAGQSLSLTLFWQALVDAPGPLTALIELHDATGQTVVSHRQQPIRPTTTWQASTLLRDPQDVSLPATLTPGEYQVTLALLTPEQVLLPVNGAERLLLTTVTTVDRPHVFEPPRPQIEMGVIFGDQARLVGVDLPKTRVKVGEWLPLTLYWQGLTSFDKSWTVFVHLVDSNGRIVSQQDQIPGGGQFPTTSWLPDEYLTDPYNLFIPTDALSGDKVYQLRIGLYDSNNFSRLPVTEAGQIVGDHVVLENWQISVE